MINANAKVEYSMVAKLTPRHLLAEELVLLRTPHISLQTKCSLSHGPRRKSMELSLAIMIYSETLQEMWPNSATVSLRTCHHSNRDVPVKVKSAFVLVKCSMEENR